MQPSIAEPDPDDVAPLSDDEIERMFAEAEALDAAEEASAPVVTSAYAPPVLIPFTVVMCILLGVGAAMIGQSDWGIRDSDVDVLFVHAFSGIGLGTLSLLCVWTVIGASPWYFRVPVGLLAGLAAIACYVLPQIPAYVWNQGLLQHLLLGTPPLMLAAQTPFWCLRALGWRLGHESLDADTRARGTQYGILHLVATGVVMAVGLMLLDASGATAENEYRSRSYAWLMVIRVFGAYAALTSIVVLPYVLIYCLARRPWLRRTLAIGYCGILCCVIVGIYWVFEGKDTLMLVRQVLLPLVVCMAVIYCGHSLLSRNGYRLLRGWRQ